MSATDRGGTEKQSADQSSQQLDGKPVEKRVEVVTLPKRPPNERLTESERGKK